MSCAQYLMKSSLCGEGMLPERLTWRSPKQPGAAGTCCPPAWRPVSVLSPATWWVGGVEDELSLGEGGGALGQGRARS